VREEAKEGNEEALHMDGEGQVYDGTIVMLP
jgi:hypothetical protein